MQVAPGRKALVTGAASGGIGLEVARSLVRAGVDVAMLDVNQELLDEAAAEVGDSARRLGRRRSPGEVQSALDGASHRARWSGRQSLSAQA